MNSIPVYIPLVPWLSALQAIGLGRRNVNRKFVLATHIISVEHGVKRSHEESAMEAS